MPVFKKERFKGSRPPPPPPPLPPPPPPPPPPTTTTTTGDTVSALTLYNLSGPAHTLDHAVASDNIG